MDINQIIKQRRSTFPKEFTGEIIEKEVIEQLLENAHWAPSHRLTLAWTFRVYEGESKNKLFDFWRNTAIPTKHEKIDFNKKQTSHVIVVTVHDKEQNPLEEEIASTACAVQNIYLSLSQFPDVGGYWGSGNGIYEPHFHEFIHAEEDEFCMGYFLLGKVKNKRKEANRSDYKNNVIWEPSL